MKNINILRRVSVRPKTAGMEELGNARPEPPGENPPASQTTTATSLLERAASLDANNLFSTRPRRISVTVYRSSLNESLGVAFEQNERGVCIESMTKGLLVMEHPAAELSPDLFETVLQVGDCLNSINGTSYQKQVTVEQVNDILEKLEGTLTFVFSPSNNTPSDHNFQLAVLVRPENNENYVELRRNRNQLLAIASLSDMWKHTVVKPASLLVGIGRDPSAHLEPDSAQQLLENSPVLFLTVLPPCYNNLRKAVVGVGGGALLSAGSVLMVTPLHPIGHAMAMGGMGILSLEFEGPRKLMNRLLWRKQQQQQQQGSMDESRVPPTTTTRTMSDELPKEAQ